MVLENIKNFFTKNTKKYEKLPKSKEEAKERLHDVLVQDRVNVSVDFLELMQQEMIDVIKKYIDIDEKQIDVRISNKENGDGTLGAPTLYAEIPVLKIKNETKKKKASKGTATKKASSTKQDNSTKQVSSKKQDETKPAAKKATAKAADVKKTAPKAESTKPVAEKKKSENKTAAKKPAEKKKTADKK